MAGEELGSKPNRRTAEERLEVAEERLALAEAALEKARAKRNQEAARTRALLKREDDRLKVLVGAAILQQCRMGLREPLEVMAMMETFLERAREREFVLGAVEGGTGSGVFWRNVEREEAEGLPDGVEDWPEPENLFPVSGD